jgi:EmrB/QacA subfamily drug resistance transporter
MSTHAGRIDPKWSILVAVALGTFMSATDAGAVNTVLPVIRRSLGSEVASVEWVVTIYLLVVSGLLLSLGRWGDLRGHRSIYIAGFALFILASAACGLAPNVVALIALRAVQGVGAAALFANSTAILTTNFPPEQRGRVLGLRATATYLGLTAGPFLGGWIAGQLGWRAVFYINVPMGSIGLWLSWHFIPRDSSSEPRAAFDLVGAATWILGLTALLLVLDRGHAWGWRSSANLGLEAMAGLLIATFIIIERRASSPLLDLALFRSRTFSAATLSSVLHYLCVYTVVFLLPFYLIQGRGYGPARAGLFLTAQSVLRAATAPISGALSDRIGSRMPAMLGMGTLAAGLLLLSRLGSQSTWWEITLDLAIVGLGSGIFISPNNSALMGSAPRHRQGIAAGALATARNVGMMLGVGLAGAIFTSGLHHGQARGANAALFEAVNAGFLVASCVAALGSLTAAAMERGDPARQTRIAASAF